MERKRSNSISNSNEDINVILYITGGGWFTHTTATDVPFLTEWSDATDSLIIIPEYKLLPEHHYPVATNEVFDVYNALSSGQAGAQLGFNAKKIVITGESAGGNMAAATIVKLLMEGVVDLEYLLGEKMREKEEREGGGGSEGNESDDTEGGKKKQVVVRSKSPLFYDATQRGVRLPDGLLMSCPTLNLCLSMSPSRVMGSGDPVLPSGLIQMIAKEYIPESCGFKKSDPVVSPYHASDDVLR